MSTSYIPADLRRLVMGRAGDRCEYCLIPQALALASHHVDHVISEKHGGRTISENLALSCSLCNQAKGSDVASVDESEVVVRLFHPRRDLWGEHFRMVTETGEIVGLSAVGQVTVRLLQMNRAEYRSQRRLLLRAGVLVV
jgi:hypothetical protein